MIAAALFLAILFQFLDAWTTARILRLGGAELNPLLSRMMATLGVRPALALKLTLAEGILASCYVTGFFGPAPWAALAIAAMSLAVVANNGVVIYRLSRLSGSMCAGTSPPIPPCPGSDGKHRNSGRH